MHRIRHCTSLAALARASRPASPEEAKTPMFAGSFAVSALDFLGGQTSRLCPNCPVSWRNISVTFIDQLSKRVNRLLSNVTRLDCRAHGKNERKGWPKSDAFCASGGVHPSFAVPSFHPVKRLSPMFRP